MSSGYGENWGSDMHQVCRYKRTLLLGNGSIDNNGEAH